MYTIEGIGDEVIQFLIAVTILLVCLLLWITTRVRNSDEPFFRTVYVLERRYNRRNNAEEERSVLLDSIEQVVEAEPENALAIQAANSQPPTVTINRSTSGDASSTTVDNEGRPIIENVTDTDANGSQNKKEATLEERTLAFFSGGLQPSTSAPQVEAKTVWNGDGNVTTETCIRIRLKYLNDDLRIVEGLAEEKLYDFKRRNFTTEINANKVIRLIFNGRLLRDDNVSLQNHGFFDNCVVHCLILNERPRQSVYPDESESVEQYGLNEQTTHQEWNLSKLLCFVIIAILTLTWYCRFQFAALFTFTSTSCLFGLTVIFLCSMFGTFYVDSVPVNGNG